MRILLEIASCYGVLLRIDHETLEGNFDHYARMLIDIDLSSDFPQMLRLW